ncbi:MAG: hypothetical protein ACK4Y4_06495, partial [Brevundimonas sp.]
MADSSDRSKTITTVAQINPGKSGNLDTSHELMMKLASEAAQLRLKVLTLSAENERLRETISFQLGNLLIGARTWRGLMDLPSGLIRLRKN